jgi:septin family protein
LIVVGESGTGKSTFIKSFLSKMRKSHYPNDVNNYSTNENSEQPYNNKDNMKKEMKFNMIEDSLFHTEEEEKDSENLNFQSSRTMNFNAHTLKFLSPKKINKFTIIDSPGYGHSLNNKKWLFQIIDYIKKRVILVLT